MELFENKLNIKEIQAQIQKYRILLKSTAKKKRYEIQEKLNELLKYKDDIIKSRSIIENTEYDTLLPKYFYINTKYKPKIPTKEMLLEKEREEHLKFYKDSKYSIANYSAKNDQRDLNILLETLSFDLVTVPGDGNCFFSSIAIQLEKRWLIQKTITDLRNLTANSLRMNLDYYLPYYIIEDNNTDHKKEFLKHCDKIQNGKAWASHIDIDALARALNASIYIYQADNINPTKISYTNSDTKKEPLTILFSIFNSHYNSLIPKKIDVPTPSLIDL